MTDHARPARGSPAARGSLAAACVALGVCAGAWAAAPQTFTEKQSSRGLAATLTYSERSDFGYRDQRLVVRRAGRAALDVRLTPESSRWPAPRGGALSLRDLDGGEPEVLVGIFTGGANCCYGLYVFRHADGRYRGSFFNAGKGGLVVANLDRRGPPELRGADERFQYLFSSGIESITPVRIYRFRAGRLVAVTREFDALVRESERETWRIARKLWQMGGNPHTVLAAWAATKYLLGEGSEVWPRLQRLIGARTIEPNLERNGPPYLRSVRSALREFGYLSLPQAG